MRIWATLATAAGLSLGLLFDAGLAVTGADAAELMPADVPVEQVIDHYIEERLAAENVSPVGQADDGNLIRRVTLDLAGRIPNLQEAQAYVASTDPAKRQLAVERLLASPDFAFHQRNELDSMLMEEIRDNDFREYLLKACQENRPWDQLFREILLANETDEPNKGAAKFVKSRVRDLDDLTNDASRLFFGVAINCAKCHDHPLVLDWRQDHYYGMYAFFQRSYLNKRDQLVERDTGLVKFKTTDGEEKQARFMFLTGQPIEEPVSTLSAEETAKLEQLRKADDEKTEGPPPAPPAFSPRSRLVELALMNDQNRFFSRSIVNRIWARLIGRGLVMPLDQMHSENPPSHPELLEWLTRDLVAHNYDLKRLIRGIVLSQTYSRSTVWQSESPPPYDQLFARGITRPLKPRQYSMALLVACRNERSFPAELSGDDWSNRRRDLENHSQHLANQLELPSDNFQVGVSEALYFNNNPHVQNDLLHDGDDRLLASVKQLTDRQAQIRLAFWTTFTRDPAPEESAAISQFLDARADRQAEAWRHILWSLLTSSELRFNY